jgi:hypothetical protein
MPSPLDRITEEQRRDLADYAAKRFREAAHDVAGKAGRLLDQHGAEATDIYIELGDWHPLFVAVDRGRLTISIDESLSLEPADD